MRLDLNLPRVVCKYVDVFPDELSGLTPHRDVDFGIELHPGNSTISMTSHRMAVRPEKFQFLGKGQNRNFDYKSVISVKNP